MKKFVSSILLSGLLLVGCSGNKSTTNPDLASSPSQVAASEAETTAVSSSTSNSSSEAEPVSAPTPKLVLGDLKSEEVSLTADHKGQADSAFQFKGDKGLTVPFNLNPEAMPQCTLVTWARYTGENRGVQQVISHDDGGYDRSLGLDDRGGEWGWSCFTGNQGVLGGFTVKPGEWTFLAVTYDESSHTTTLYVDGEKKEATDAQLGAGQETMSLGSNPSYGEYFEGDVEPVMVFDRVLTEEEIKALQK